MIAETNLEAQPTLTLEAVVAHGSVRWALAGAEAVVQVPALAATYVLDPTAAMLWQCLDGVSPLGALFADIAHAFGVPAQQVAADCLPVMGSWLHAHIAVLAGAAAPGGDTFPLDPDSSGRTWRRLVDPPNT